MTRSDLHSGRCLGISGKCKTLHAPPAAPQWLARNAARKLENKPSHTGMKPGFRKPGVHSLVLKSSHSSPRPHVTRPVLFISFLDYWQVTLIWSPYGDASLIRSLLIGDTSTIYYTDVAIRVTMTLY